MSTPSYLGPSQPSDQTNGWLARLASYFGTAKTPAYDGDGHQATPNVSGFFVGSAPAYLPAPESQPSCETETSADESAQVMCPIDSEALAQGQIAIVIPRQGT